MRLVVREQRARMTRNALGRLLYACSFELAETCYRAGLLGPLASGGPAKCRSGASVHTANARRAAGPSEPTPQNPFARHRLRRFNKTGRALFEALPLLGIGCETTSILREKRSSWATACWETGNRDSRVRMDQLLVKHRCTLARPQKRGVTRMERDRGASAR